MQTRNKAILFSRRKQGRTEVEHNSDEPKAQATKLTTAMCKIKAENKVVRI